MSERENRPSTHYTCVRLRHVVGDIRPRCSVCVRACVRAYVLFFFCSTILERKGRLLVSLLVFEVAGKMTKVAMQGKKRSVTSWG